MYEQLSIHDFDAFFKILEAHFPSKEIKEYDYLKGLFEKGTAQAIIQKDRNTIIGALCYMDIGTYAFVDYLVIVDGYQGQRLGEKLLRYFKEYINKPIILEVEFPQDEISRRRIKFYQRQGFILNEHEYVIPPVRSLKEPIYFVLMTYPEVLTEKEYEEIYPSILKNVYEIGEI